MLRDLAAVSSQTDRLLVMLLDGGRTELLIRRRAEVEAQMQNKMHELQVLQDQHAALCDAIGHPQRVREFRVDMHTKLEDRHCENFFNIPIFDQYADQVRTTISKLKKQEQHYAKEEREKKEREYLGMLDDEDSDETDGEKTQEEKKEKEEEEQEQLIRMGAMRRDRD